MLRDFGMPVVPPVWKRPRRGLLSGHQISSCCRLLGDGFVEIDNVGAVVHFDLGADQRHDEFLDASDVAQVSTTVLTLGKISGVSHCASVFRKALSVTRL
jgi:hypothetical protein